MKKDWRDVLTEAFAKARLNMLADGKTFAWDTSNRMPPELMEEFLKEIIQITVPNDNMEEDKKVNALLRKHEEMHAVIKAAFAVPAYEIEGENEPNGEGNGWSICEDDEATVFRIYPFDEDEPALDETFKTRAEAEAWAKENLTGETK